MADIRPVQTGMASLPKVHRAAAAIVPAPISLT